MIESSSLYKRQIRESDIMVVDKQKCFSSLTSDNVNLPLRRMIFLTMDTIFSFDFNFVSFLLFYKNCRPAQVLTDFFFFTEKKKS